MLTANEELSPELSRAVASLAVSDDAALWRASQAKFPIDKSAQLEMLHLRCQTGIITDAEARQAAELAAELEKFMFLRAQAMSFLLQRGHDLTAVGE